MIVAVVSAPLATSAIETTGLETILYPLALAFAIQLNLIYEWVSESAAEAVGLAIWANKVALDYSTLALLPNELTAQTPNL